MVVAPLAGYTIPNAGINIPRMGTQKRSHQRTARTRSRPRTAAPRASLANALFAATQQRVLALLFGAPERSYFTSELIRLVQAGSGAVQRELQRLTDSGLVTVTRVGNQKHYQANVNAPIFDELRSIVAKTIGPADVLRGALAPLGHKLLLAVLYGSVAKRTDSAQSDLDVLIVSDVLTLEDIYSALAIAEKQLGRHVSPTLYTRQEFRTRRTAGNPFLTKVLAGKFIPLTDDADAFIAAR